MGTYVRYSVLHVTLLHSDDHYGKGVNTYLPCIWSGDRKQTKNEEHETVVLTQNKTSIFFEKKVQLRGKRAAEEHEVVWVVVVVYATQNVGIGRDVTALELAERYIDHRRQFGSIVVIHIIHVVVVVV